MPRKKTTRNSRPNLSIEGFDALTVSKTFISIVESLTSGVPESTEPRSRAPQERSRELARAAALKAAAISGGLSLPPGPLGLLTAVPELLAIWKLQVQLVNDIAGAFGEQPPVQQEKMVYCLFKNMACQVAKDAAVRVAERVLVRRAAKSLAGRVFVRCGVPILGAAGAAAYAWFDTMQVAKRAIALFENQQRPKLNQKKSRRQTQSRKPVRKRVSVAKQAENVIALESVSERPVAVRKVAKPSSRARQLRRAA